MIIAQQKKDVVKSQEFETLKYSVSTENLAMLFQMLRTNLYSDLHGSIIREVVSNVHDSHVEAGKPDAVGEIEWVSPNRLLGIDTQLIIRDFGVGLSPDRMRETYANYLSSTKRGDNTQTGGFGLGSKSPFAYTDSFFVKTVFDGVSYKYLCYIDSSKLGAISLLGREETDAINGTEIVLPIKKDYDDLQLFKKAIIRQLSYFKNLKYINIEGPSGEVQFENEHCIILKNPPIQDTHIVLGNVAYTLNQKILTHPDHHDQTGIGIKFAIGDLQPTMSREEISWDDASKAKIEAALRRTKKSLKVIAEAEFAVETDYAKSWAIRATSTTNTFSNRHQLDFCDAVRGSIQIKGVSLDFNVNSYTWFSGYKLRTITPNTYSQNRVYDANYSTGGDIARLPIYRLDGVLKGLIIQWLFTLHPDGFIVISLDSKAFVHETHEVYRKATIDWAQTIPSFDTVIVPDGFKPLKASPGPAHYKSIVAARKLAGKFVAKKMSYWLTDRYKVNENLVYSMYESKFEDCTKQTIIYGFQEDHADMCFVNYTLQSSKDFSEKWNRGINRGSSEGYMFLKIARSYAQQFAAMPNAHYVGKVISLDTPLTPLLAKITTAIKLREVIHQYHILQFFNEIDPGMCTLYKTVHKFIEEYSVTNIGTSMITPRLEQTNLDTEMEGCFKAIRQYFVGVELLKSPNFLMYSDEHTSGHDEGDWVRYLREYVKLNKTSIKQYLETKLAADAKPDSV